MKSFHKVLLVDDDPASTYLNEILIETANIADQVIAVANGADALAFIEEHCIRDIYDCPNLILLDLHMPVLDGLELLAELKNRDKANLINTKIAVLTSSIHPKDIHDLQELGVKNIIEKPLTKQKIEALIKKFEHKN